MACERAKPTIEEAGRRERRRKQLLKDVDKTRTSGN